MWIALILENFFAQDFSCYFHDLVIFSLNFTYTCFGSWSKYLQRTIKPLSKTYNFIGSIKIQIFILIKNWWKLILLFHSDSHSTMYRKGYEFFKLPNLVARPSVSWQSSAFSLRLKYLPTPEAPDSAFGDFCWWSSCLPLCNQQSSCSSLAHPSCSSNCR